MKKNPNLFCNYTTIYSVFNKIKSKEEERNWLQAATTVHEALGAVRVSTRNEVDGFAEKRPSQGS